MKQLEKINWIVFARVENLSELPFSTDKRIRVQITFKAGSDKDLQKRVFIMEKILEDKTIRGRIISSIKRLDVYFSDLVYKKEIFKNFLAGE